MANPLNEQEQESTPTPTTFSFYRSGATFDSRPCLTDQNVNRLSTHAAVTPLPCCKHALQLQSSLQGMALAMFKLASAR